MPGIVTHSIILKDTIDLLAKKPKKSYLLKSIEALFRTPEYLSSGLFGSIGPNIFDYIPGGKTKYSYGNDISFFIHNGGSEKIIQSMITHIYSYKDKNTEWAATQRAYLYGFISHIVSDSIFHPFIFYYSGFPSTSSINEIHHFRHQNLLFQYHIDNYLQYHDEKTAGYGFNLDEMLKMKKNRFAYRVEPAVKCLLHDSIKESYPEIHSKIVLLNKKTSDAPCRKTLGYLDLIPYMIKMTYWLKRNESTRLAKLLKALLKKNILFSDFMVQYPKNKKYDKNVVNKHRERWENPAGKPGLHYESVNNLLSASGEQIIRIWEKIESCLYAKEDMNVMADFKTNTYTGDEKFAYRDMKVSRPIRLSGLN